MKIQKIALLTLVILTFNSCDSEINKQNNSIRDNSSETRFTDLVQPSGEVSNVSTVNQPLNQSIPIPKDRMIIRTGNMNLEIENYDESEKLILGETNKQKGYITNSSSSVNASGKKQGLIEAKIPSANFDSFISNISNIGKVMSLNVTGNDITEEYIDLEARHKTQKALEDRLIKLLNEKTAKLTEVVEVEQKLSEVRAHIESMEGRLRYLKNQSEYSTLTISLFEPSLLQTSSGGGFFYEISEAFKEGLNGFTEVLKGLITFVVAFSPIIFSVLILFFLIRKFKQKRKLKKSEFQIQGN